MDPDRNDQRSAARVRLTYDDIDIKAVIGGTQELDVMPKALMLQLKKGINTVEAFGYLNRQGELYKYVTNTLAANTAFVRAIAPLISNDVLGALQVCSIPIPNKDLNPLETWRTSKNLSLTVGYLSSVDPEDESPPAPGSRGGRGGAARPKAREYKYNQEVVYTYLGTRTRGGKKEAVVKVEGKSSPAAGQAKESVNGEMKGYSFVDVNTGVVIESEIESEFEIDTSEQGFKKKLSSLDKYKIVRGSQTN
jgi:hypothetical protein